MEFTFKIKTKFVDSPELRIDMSDDWDACADKGDGGLQRKAEELLAKWVHDEEHVDRMFEGVDSIADEGGYHKFFTLVMNNMEVAKTLAGRHDPTTFKIPRVYTALRVPLAHTELRIPRVPERTRCESHVHTGLMGRISMNEALIPCPHWAHGPSYPHCLDRVAYT
jgi:hypothetical protein